MEHQNKTSLQDQLKRLIWSVLLPVFLVLASVLILFFSYHSQYTGAFANVTMASQFNQNFKDDVDLKMYYYVIDSRYAEGLPIAQVDTAHDLATTLATQAKSAQGKKSMASVMDLCDSLKHCLYEIESTTSYDDRMALLESNVYILTELIQEYMYTYLYYEAGHLSQLQQSLNDSLWVELILVSLITGTLVILAIRQSVSIGRNISQPIKGLSRRVEQIGQGNLTVSRPVPAQDPDLQILSEGFEQMVSKVNGLVEENQNEQKKIRAMELSLLQAQINPHFLYNTLDAIVWLVETGKNQDAVGMVTSLSSFFRSSLSGGRDIITLGEEENHIRSYLEIQQVRYRDILRYHIQMDSSIASCPIPKLTLQPLVENALYHGIKSKRGGGLITVTSQDLEDTILLEVTDTGAGMTPHRLSKLQDSLGTEETVGFGVNTVYRRLQLLTAGTCRWEIQSAEMVGTKFSVTIPKGIANPKEVL